MSAGLYCDRAWEGLEYIGVGATPLEPHGDADRKVKRSGMEMGS